MSLSPRRTLFALAIFSAIPLLAACPKKEPPPFDAGPPPPPPEDVAPVLQEMPVDDAGPDVDAADAAKPKGPAVNTNVARLKQCCNQLAVQGKQLGNSPEAGMFTSAAAQCNAIASQVAPGGTAPELGVIRNLLAGRTLPAACAGF